MVRCYDSHVNKDNFRAYVLVVLRGLQKLEKNRYNLIQFDYSNFLKKTSKNQMEFPQNRIEQFLFADLLLYCI